MRRAAKKGDAELLTFEAADVLARVAKRGDEFAPLLSLKQALPRFEPV